jgi:hypothetical protein
MFVNQLQNTQRTSNYITILMYGLYTFQIYSAMKIMKYFWFYLFENNAYSGIQMADTLIQKSGIQMADTLIQKSGIQIADTLCQLLSSYIHFLNIPVAIYIYSKRNPQWKNAFDVFGITGLSITTYMYHHEIYRRLYTNKITEYLLPDKNNIALFLNDNIFIHLRSFLALYTNYYNHPNYIKVVATSAGLHAFSLYNGVFNILDLLFVYDGITQTQFSWKNDIITIIPLSFDILSIYTNSSKKTGIPFLFSSIALLFVFIIEPLYRLNHVLYHILLVVHNYYFCRSNNNQ